MILVSNRFGHFKESDDVTNTAPAFDSIHSYDAGMVTRSTNPRRLLYVVEWRKHLNVSPEKIAEAFGIERESVHRMEREQNRMNAEKIAKYADVLGILPEQLWRPPTSSGTGSAEIGLTAAEREVALSLLTKLTSPATKPKKSKPKGA